MLKTPLNKVTVKVQMISKTVITFRMVCSDMVKMIFLMISNQY